MKADGIRSWRRFSLVTMSLSSLAITMRRRSLPVIPTQALPLPPEVADDEQLRNTIFSDTEHLVEGDSLNDTHGLYRVAPRDVARRMNCHFIDANLITENLEKSLGREGSKKLHMWFRPGEEPSLPKGKQDNTHYNIYGAQVVANLLADARTNSQENRDIEGA